MQHVTRLFVEVLTSDVGASSDLRDREVKDALKAAFQTAQKEDSRIIAFEVVYIPQFFLRVQ